MTDYQRPSGLFVPRSAATTGGAHNHAPSQRNQDPYRDRLDDEVVAKREEYATEVLGNHRLDQNGLVIGLLYREDEKVTQTREEYLDAVIESIYYDFEQQQTAAQVLQSPLRPATQPGMTNEEVSDGKAQGTPNDQLTTRAVAEWDSLTNTFIEKIPVEGRRRKKKLKEIFSKQNVRDIRSDSKETASRIAVPVVAGLAAGAFNGVVHLGGKEAIPYLLAGGVSFISTSQKASKESLSSTDPSKNPDANVKGKVETMLEGLGFTESSDQQKQVSKTEQVVIIDRWMKVNNIDTGPISSLSTYKKEKEQLVDYLKEELVKNGGKDQDRLRVEMAVKLTFLEQEYSRSKKVKGERLLQAAKRTLGAVAIGVALGIFAIPAIAENDKQEEQKEQIEQDNQDYIDHLPPVENGVPDEDPSSFEDLYHKAKQENN